MRKITARIAMLILLALPVAAASALKKEEPRPQGGQKAGASAAARSSKKNNPPGQNANTNRHGKVGGGTTAGGLSSSSPGEPATNVNGNRGAAPESEPVVAGEPPEPSSPLYDWLYLLGALLAVVLVLGLHLIHFLTGQQLKEGITQLQRRVHTVSEQQKKLQEDGGGAAGANTEPRKLAAQLHEQQQTIQQLASRLDDVSRRYSASEKRAVDAVAAIALATRFAGEERIQHEVRKLGSEASESDRALMAKILEHYGEQLGANFNRVKPLAEAFSEFMERLRQRPSLPADFVARAGALHQEICQFGKWHSEASAELAALRRGSVAERLKLFKSQERRLTESFDLGEVAAAEYVRRHRDLVKQYFPDQQASAPPALSPAEREAQLQKAASGAPAYLMDWFDRLFQFQSASQPFIDEKTDAELASLRRLAASALVKFDIQPEEIQLGRTSFDNRLYDAALITQSSGYPVNTVVGIHQCGFRRVSTGEVLRRPQVVVAGVGVA